MHDHHRLRHRPQPLEPDQKGKQFTQIPSATACGFIVFGWGGEGYLSQICLILGGWGLGATVTDALNYTGE